MIRPAAAIALALAALPTLAADTFAGVLRAYVGKPVSINEHGQYQADTPLQRVGEDYFCVEVKMQDTGRAVPRCYPFSAVTFVSAGDRVVIGLR